MTRKDFQLIADVLADVGTNYASIDHYRTALVYTFADRLAETNDRFDYDRFISACEREETARA